MINRDLTKAGTKLFSSCAANIRARLNKIWQKREKLHWLSTCCSFEEKKSTFYRFFQASSLFSRLFQGLENSWTNFKTFSSIQDSVRTLCDHGYKKRQGLGNKGNYIFGLTALGAWRDVTSDYIKKLLLWHNAERWLLRAELLNEATTRTFSRTTWNIKLKDFFCSKQEEMT